MLTRVKRDNSFIILSLLKNDQKLLNPYHQTFNKLGPLKKYPKDPFLLVSNKPTRNNFFHNNHFLKFINNLMVMGKRHKNFKIILKVFHFFNTSNFLVYQGGENWWKYFLVKN